MKIKSAKYYANAFDASAEPIMIKVDYENAPSRDVPTDPTNTDYINASDGYTVTGSGDPFAMQYDYLKLPRTYSSGDTITGQMTFANTTIADLDLAVGSVSYQLGNNTMEIYTSPSPLPILGLPVVFSYFKKLKEKSRLRGRIK